MPITGSRSGGNTDLSEEVPSSRADVSVLREGTGLQFEVKVGPIKAQASVDGEPDSTPFSVLTLLLLAGAACVLSLGFSLLFWAGGFVLGISAVGLFGVLFAGGLALIRLGLPRPARTPPQRVPSQRGPSEE
ncbi:hypothetical protein G4Z16_14300 [Streptomyces bathyalis]|uniref:Uncharacterized protein n=1 Tax=Streptomyces bathyalis TaxID=2710756 RepID=A0A7T1T6L8_9ACTN|nr:hypothetical protein [Streptomyces bathyalis]QPP07363.1 hypothetical protein G4Z16_14300 [Streptomyces bathyalis]